MAQEFREISPELERVAYKEAWSIESMEAHGAGGREVTYIGSKISGALDGDERNGRLVFDYYRDTEGAWWFENRALLPSGDIVSMDMYLFGYEGKRKKGERQQWKR